MSNYKHLSLEERKEIESLLTVSDIPLKVISSKLNRSDKCIRYEVINHRQLKVRSNQHNKCGRQNECQIQRLCTHCLNGFCKGCRHNQCNELCPDFISTPVCKRTQRFPYVCSGCPSIETCKLPKYFYYASYAQQEYEKDKTAWREGCRKSEAELKVINDTLVKYVDKNHSLDVIIHKHNLNISLSTAYRYIDRHYIEGVNNIDLKRKVRYSPRKGSRPVLTPINYDFLNGRRYSDFIKALESLPSDTNIWEMDTVIGKKTGDQKCVLSLLHRQSNLQLYFLLESKTALEVNKVFDKIKTYLSDELFKAMFTVILTDNGSEFHDPLSIETSLVTGEKLINVYYCEARRSDEKGQCEKNHEHFRELVPKGLSMNSLTQKDINYVSNMINNYPRAKYQYHSPYEIAKLMLNKKVLDLNRLVYHPIEQVDLKPILH